MAHDNNPKKNTPEYIDIQRGLVAWEDRRRDSAPEIKFVEWLTMRSVNNAWGKLDMYSGMGDGDPASWARPSCILDCLFDWLSTPRIINTEDKYPYPKDGYEEPVVFELLDTYEEWLLVIISVMDQVHRGVLVSSRGADMGDLTLEDLSLREPGVETDKWYLDLGEMEFFERPLDRSHPALDRRNFERLRARYLATQGK